MKTSHLALIAGCLGSLLALPAAAAPGNGWGFVDVCGGDGPRVFQDCQADRVSVRPYLGTSLDDHAGQGYDTFRACLTGQLAAVFASCDRAPVATPAYTGTSMGGGEGKGWNLFRAHSMAIT